jgi:hypothetical protein
LRDRANFLRIRAIRRCGELLQEIPPATGAHLKRDGAVPLSRTQAATEAGLSEHQRKQALRVANLLAEEFEALTGPQPATVTELGRARQVAPHGADEERPAKL